MIVSFRCKRSGNVVSFYNQDDILGLRKHEGYMEIKDETNANEAVKVEEAPKAQVLVPKKKGRPFKTARV